MSIDAGMGKKVRVAKHYSNAMTTSLQKSYKQIEWGFFATFTVLAFTIFVSVNNNIPFSYLSRDAASVADERFYIGLLSNIGVMCWAIGAGFCFFGYLLLRTHYKNGRHAAFLLYAGLLTLLLLTDDLFLIHEEFMPHVLHISGKVWFMIYVGAIAGFLLLFYREILQTRFILLLLAFLFFAASVLFDVRPFGLGAALQSSAIFHVPNGSVTGDADHDDLAFLLEDGFKFAGIIFWTLYFGITALWMAKQFRK